MNKLKIYSVSVLLTCLSINIHAQGNFWKAKDAYLGQAPPTDTPKVFAKGILCDTGS